MAASESILSMEPRIILQKKKEEKKDKGTEKITCSVYEGAVQLVASFLSRNGFSKTLTVLESEAKIQIDDSKFNSLILEDIYQKYLNSREQNGTISTQIMEPDKHNAESDLGHPSNNFEFNAKSKKKIKAKENGLKSKDTDVRTSEDERRGADAKSDDHEVSHDPLEKKKKKKEGKHCTDSLSQDKVQPLTLGATMQEGEIQVSNEKKSKKRRMSACENGPLVTEGMDVESEESTKKKRQAKELHLEHESIVDDGKEKIELIENKKSKKQKGEKSKKSGLHLEHESTINGEMEKTKPVEDLEKKSKKQKEEKSKKSGLHVERESIVNGEKQKIEPTEDAEKKSKKQKGEKTGKASHEKFDHLDGNVVGPADPKGVEFETTDNDDNGNDKKAATNKNDSDILQNECKDSVEGTTVNAFHRVKVDEVTFADERLQDNSYWAKDASGDGYGAKAQVVLGQVKGKNFRHEKTKKKRGSYRGGLIDMHSYSVKFSNSDDDE